MRSASSRAARMRPNRGAGKFASPAGSDNAGGGGVPLIIIFIFVVATAAVALTAWTLLNVHSSMRNDLRSVGSSHSGASSRSQHKRHSSALIVDAVTHHKEEKKDSEKEPNHIVPPPTRANQRAGLAADDVVPRGNKEDVGENNNAIGAQNGDANTDNNNKGVGAALSSDASIPQRLAKTAFLKLKRVSQKDVKKYILDTVERLERSGKGKGGGNPRDKDRVQMVVQSARTGAVLHPVGFSSPAKCDVNMAKAYAIKRDEMMAAQSKTDGVVNSIVLPSSSVASCLSSDTGSSGEIAEDSPLFFSFSPLATEAYISIVDFNAVVYNVTIAPRKFKKVGEDGMVVAANAQQGGAEEENDPETAAAPKDLKLRAANYGNYLSREVHHGTVTVDKMWARSMESWNVVAREMDKSPFLSSSASSSSVLYTFEMRGIPHELQPKGESMCIGFPTDVPPSPLTSSRNKALKSNKVFVPPRFIDVGDVRSADSAQGIVLSPDGRNGHVRGPLCDQYILWEVAEGEVEKAISNYDNALSKIADKGGEGDGESSSLSSTARPVPIHFVAALSVRNMAIFNSEKQRYNDKVVFDNWLRLLQMGNRQYPSVLTQLALCLDVPEDLEPILIAAEGYGYTVDAGTVVILRSPSAVNPPSAHTSAEGRFTTHRTLRDFFTSREHQSQQQFTASDGTATPIVPLLVISAHCEKHPSYKMQPTYRGAFAFAEYALRASQLYMQQRAAAASSAVAAAAVPVPLHPSVPIAVDASFVAFANSDIVLDYTDVFRTLSAVAVEMAKQADDRADSAAFSGGGGGGGEDAPLTFESPTKPRPVLVSGRRWNCNTHHIQKAIKQFNKNAAKQKGGRGGKKRGGDDAEDDQSSASSSSATFMDTHYLRNRCTLFGDNAQDYFLVSAGALHWGMPPGIAASDAYAGAKGALKRAVADSHDDITVFVAEKVKDMVSSGAIRSSTVPADSFPDSYVPASDYRRSSRPARWNSHTHFIPPFVVGGIAFDNWFVSAMMDKRRPSKQQGTGEPLAWVIDASASLYAFHINHDEGRFQSHRAPKSDYNLEMAHYCHGWPEGKVGVSPIVSLRLPFDASSSSMVPFSSSVVGGSSGSSGGDDDSSTRVVIHRRSILYCPIGMRAEQCRLPPANVERRVLAFDGRFEPRH